jgi:hypothetical protein
LIPLNSSGKMKCPRYGHEFTASRRTKLVWVRADGPNFERDADEDPDLPPRLQPSQLTSEPDMAMSDMLEFLRKACVPKLPPAQQRLYHAMSARDLAVSDSLVACDKKLLAEIAATVQVPVPELEPLRQKTYANLKAMLA